MTEDYFYEPDFKVEPAPESVPTLSDRLRELPDAKYSDFYMYALKHFGISRHSAPHVQIRTFLSVDPQDLLLILDAVERMYK